MADMYSAFRKKAWPILDSLGLPLRLLPDSLCLELVLRIPTGYKGSGLSTVVETAGVRVERQEGRNGSFPKPWDAIERVVLLLEDKMVVDLVFNGLY